MIYVIFINMLHLTAILLSIVLAFLFVEKKIFNKYFSLLLTDIAFITIVIAFKHSETYVFGKRTPAHYYSVLVLLFSVLPLLYAAIRRVKREDFCGEDLKKLPALLLLLPPALGNILGIKVPKIIEHIDELLPGSPFYYLWVYSREIAIAILFLWLSILCLQLFSKKREYKDRKVQFEIEILKVFSLYTILVFPAVIVFRYAYPIIPFRSISVIITTLILLPLLFLLAVFPKLSKNAGVKYQKSSLSNSEAADIVNKARQLIEAQKLWREPTLNQPRVAGMLGLSVNKLSQAINGELGVNFNNLINGYRIEEAKELLQHSDMKVIEVAYLTGFETLSRFYTLFKKTAKSTPSDYRKAFTGRLEE